MCILKHRKKEQEKIVWEWSYSACQAKGLNGEWLVSVLRGNANKEDFDRYPLFKV